MSACGGGSGVGTAVSLPEGARGRLKIDFGTRVPKGVYPEVKGKLAAQVETMGGRFDDAHFAIAAPRQPMGGYWVRVGKTTVMADRDGAFTLPPGAAGKSAEVLRDRTDAKPVLRFPLSMLAGSAGQPKEIVATVYRDIASGMGGAEGRGGQAASCCPPQGRVERFKCLDYDGPLGDGKFYNDILDWRRYWNYLGSFCQRQVWSGVCTLEKESEIAIVGTAGWAVVAMKGCYENHGFRFCQEITNEFDLQQDGEAAPGDAVWLSIKNTTAATESSITLEGPGTLFDPRKKTTGAALDLRHSHPLPGSEFGGDHQDVERFQYRAELPPGVDEATATITARSGGSVDVVRIVVKRPLSDKVYFRVNGGIKETGWRGWSDPSSTIQNKAIPPMFGESISWNESANVLYGAQFSGQNHVRGSASGRSFSVDGQAEYLMDHPGGGMINFAGMSVGTTVDIFVEDPRRRFRLDFSNSPTLVATSDPNDGRPGTGIPGTSGDLSFNGKAYPGTGPYSVEFQGVNAETTIDGKPYHYAGTLSVSLGANGGFTAIIGVPAVKTVSRSTMSVRAKVEPLGP